MRVTMTILGLAGIVALAGCGGGAGAAKAAAEAECQTAMTKAGAPPGVDGARLCSCIVGRLSEGKSEQQVREMFASKTPPPEAATVSMQCVQESMTK